MADQVQVLINALDYIEEHIASDLMVQDIADYCYVSLSSLQKTFKFVFHYSVKDYMLRRRFTCAAKELLATEDNILDIALKYGYSNAESFIRGFRKVWGITPSEYRRTRRFSGHTPRLSFPIWNPLGKEPTMNGTKYGQTELYDVLKERKNKAYVCIDLKHLSVINENLGTEAGDAAILEVMKRVEKACNDEDVFLRIGGDEFVVFTNSDEMNHANEIVKTVSAQNEEKVTCGELVFPVSVHIGAFLGVRESSDEYEKLIAKISDDIDKVHQF